MDYQCLLLCNIFMDNIIPFSVKLTKGLNGIFQFSDAHNLPSKNNGQNADFFNNTPSSFISHFALRIQHEKMLNNFKGISRKLLG